MDGESETFIAHSLRAEGFDASEDGTGRGTPLVPVAFSCKDHGADAGDIAPTLRSMGHSGSHANAGGQVAVAFNWQGGGTQTTLGYDPDSGVAGSLHVGQTPAVAFQSSQSGVRTGEAHATLDSNNGSRRHNGVIDGMAMRRLTPRECERLQGFPDDYTLIPYRNKPAADGPRYKALGNSMAVPVMAWIGARIDQVRAILAAERRAA